MNEKSYVVYVLSDKFNDKLYVGSTDDIENNLTNFGRVFEGKVLDKLVYYEEFPNAHLATFRYQSLRMWNEEWLNSLVTEVNPNWDEINKIAGNC